MPPDFPPQYERQAVFPAFATPDVVHNLRHVLLHYNVPSLKLKLLAFVVANLSPYRFKVLHSKLPPDLRADCNITEPRLVKGARDATHAQSVAEDTHLFCKGPSHSEPARPPLLDAFPYHVNDTIIGLKPSTRCPRSNPRLDRARDVVRHLRTRARVLQEGSTGQSLQRIHCVNKTNNSVHRHGFQVGGTSCTFQIWVILSPTHTSIDRSSHAVRKLRFGVCGTHPPRGDPYLSVSSVHYFH